MKKQVLFAVLAGLIVLASCSPPVETRGEEEDSTPNYCGEFSTARIQRVVEVGVVPGDITSFVLEPPQGCGLPKLYCVGYDISFGGGISCVKIGD